MKLLFWILAILSIPAGLFLTMVGFFGPLQHRDWTDPIQFCRGWGVLPVPRWSRRYIHAGDRRAWHGLCDRNRPEWEHLRFQYQRRRNGSCRSIYVGNDSFLSVQVKALHRHQAAENWKGQGRAGNSCCVPCSLYYQWPVSYCDGLPVGRSFLLCSPFLPPFCLLWSAILK